MSLTDYPSEEALAPYTARRPDPTLLSRMKRWVRRAVFLIHRWLGIVLALLMAVWAISGIVMMYVSFPETTHQERLQGLEPLSFSENCCETGSLLADGPFFREASVEMLAGGPVLRVAGYTGSSTISLADGTTPPVDAATAAEVASGHLLRLSGEAGAPAVETIDRDQWTVYGRFRTHYPLYKANFADDAGSVLYISGTNGQVVQDTTAHERFWNWLGAVPHWLYFTALRENQPLWYNGVVYSSLLGVFLTLTGLYIGIRQYGRGKRRIPYRGMAYWHHLTGLVFGILTLTWVASGLFSMNPWGWLESEGPGSEMAALAGREIETEDVSLLVSSLAASGASGAVNARLELQQSRPYAILSYADGTAERASLPGLAVETPAAPELEALAAAAKPGVPVSSQELIEGPDAYYYGHHKDVVLPAWRVIYGDEGKTRLYFDPRTGSLLRKVDAPGRAFRWLHLGLHRMDFTQSLRARPVWDIIVVPLMLGVTLLCLIGFLIGMKRLFRKRAA